MPYQCSVRRNEAQNGIEIQFSKRPPQEILDQVKAHGFRWSRRNKVWYTKYTAAKLEFASELCSENPANLVSVPEEVAGKRLITAAVVTRRGKVPKNLVFSELEAGRLEVAEYKVSDPYTDGYRYIKKEDLVWGDPNDDEYLQSELKYKNSLNTNAFDSFFYAESTGWVRFRGWYLRYKEDADGLTVVEGDTDLDGVAEEEVLPTSEKINTLEFREMLFELKEKVKNYFTYEVLEKTDTLTHFVYRSRWEGFRQGVVELYVNDKKGNLGYSVKFEEENKFGNHITLLENGWDVEAEDIGRKLEFFLTDLAATYSIYHHNTLPSEFQIYKGWLGDWLVEAGESYLQYFKGDTEGRVRVETKQSGQDKKYRVGYAPHGGENMKFRSYSKESSARNALIELLDLGNLGRDYNQTFDWEKPLLGNDTQNTEVSEDIQSTAINSEAVEYAADRPDAEPWQQALVSLKNFFAFGYYWKVTGVVRTIKEGGFVLSQGLYGATEEGDPSDELYVEVAITYIQAQGDTPEYVKIKPVNHTYLPLDKDLDLHWSRVWEFDSLSDASSELETLVTNLTEVFHPPLKERKFADTHDALFNDTLATYWPLVSKRISEEEPQVTYTWFNQQVGEALSVVNWNDKYLVLLAYRGLDSPVPVASGDDPQEALKNAKLRATGYNHAIDEPTGESLADRLERVEFTEEAKQSAEDIKSLLRGGTEITTPAADKVILPTRLKAVMPLHQQNVLKALTGEGVEEMQPVVDRLEQEWQNMPAFRSQDGSGKEAVIHAHYFYAGSDWWITEYDPKEEMAYGYVVLNGDWQMSEFGNIYIPELRDHGKIELDFYWEQKTVNEVMPNNSHRTAATDRDSELNSSAAVDSAPPASDKSLWINDHYYTQNPQHVHDEFFTKSGRYGEVTSVKSDSLTDSLARIDTGGAELNWSTTSPERDIIRQAEKPATAAAQPLGSSDEDPYERAVRQSARELESKADARKKRSQKRGAAQRDAAQRVSAEAGDAVDTAEVPMFTAEEVAATYNEGLTEDDFRIFAYYWQQQGQPLEGYYASLPTPDEDEVIGWIEQGKLYYFGEQLIPDYFYLAEDVYEKETVFQRERAVIANRYGEAVATRQAKALSEVFQNHYRGRLLLDHNLPEAERLVVDPESSFAYQFKVKGLVSAESFRIRMVTAPKNKRFGQPDFIKDVNSTDEDRTSVEELSLRQAYHYWLVKNARTVTFKKPVDSIELIKIGSYRTPRPQDTDATVWSTKKANVQSEYKRLFAEFLSTELLPEDRTRLETKWNREYNNYLPIDYTRVPIAFPMGKTYRDMPVDIRPEKRDAVTFMLSQGSGCLAYDVGFGKTWSAIFIISQMLHTGRCRRPLLIVPNQVYKQFLLEIKGLAPHIPVREYYNLDQEHLEYARNFPPEDGTLTMMTYEGLRKLGFNEATSREYMNELIEITQQGFEQAKSKKQQAIQESVLERIGQMLTGSEVNIEEFGWDFFCVDEAHSMKKIFTSVKGEMINGERQGNSYEIQSGSPSTLGLKGFAVANYILRRNHRRNVLLLTATPFTNSPLEVYSMLALVGYDSLVKRGIKNIKQFFDTYVDTDYRLVINAQLQPERRQVVTGFRNLKSLQALIYRSFDRKDINTKNAKGQGVSVKRPEKWVLPLRTQQAKGANGETQWVYVEQDERVESILPLTEYQAEIMADVKSYASGHREFDLLCDRFLELEAAGDVEENTTVEVAERVEAHSLDEKEQAGVRLLRAMSLSRNLALSPYLHVCRNLPPLTYRSYVETSPKLQYVMDCVKSVRQHHLERNEPVSGQVIYMDRGVDHFPLIKEYLVKVVGYEPHEVGIMRSNMSSVKPKGVATGDAKAYVQNLFLGKKWVESRKEFVDVPDSERIKVIIGTGTIKEGVNLQRYGTVLYNCFIDWNPTDQIQLEGRIWRQGNLYRNVRIVNVLMEDSADIFLFQKLEEKTGRINQLWNRDGSSNTFNLDEFNPEELKYTLISDPVVIAQLEIEEEEARIREGKMALENDIKQIIAVQEAFRDRDAYVDRLLPYLQEANLRVAADRQQDTEYLRAKLAGIIRSQKLPMNGNLEDTKVERVAVKVYYTEGAGRDTRYPQYRANQQFKPDWWSSYARALRLVKRFEETYLKPRGWHPDRLDSERQRIQEKIADVEQQIKELFSGESKRARRLRIEMEREENRQISKNLTARVEDFTTLNYLLNERKEVVIEAKDEAPTREAIEKALGGLVALEKYSSGEQKESVGKAVRGLRTLLKYTPAA